MKKILILIIAILNIVNVFAQEKGINFFKGSWADLVKTAETKEKMIFIDVYTDWCGPCKYMDKYIFTQENVGRRYNTAFINYKLDAEKGEGPEISKRFNILAYPTFLFLNSSGYLIYKVEGERETNEFISISEQALKENKNESNLGNFEKKFNDGVRDTGFLKRYITQLSAFRMDNSKVIDEYFKLIPDTQLKQESTIFYIAENISNTNTYTVPFLLDSYRSLQGNAKEKLLNILYQKFVSGSLFNDRRCLEIQGMFDFFDNSGQLSKDQQDRLNWYKMHYYELTRNNRSLIKTGYQLAPEIFTISKDSLKSEDERRYKAIMQPFWNGEKDSTKIETFEEEKPLLVRTYTNEISNKLYRIAKSFARLPDTEQKSLRDALIWAKRSAELMPDIKPFGILVAELEKRIK